MDRSADEVRFRLGQVPGQEVDVRLRRAGSSWLAVATAGGADTASLGGTAREALARALTAAAPRAAAALMADITLFGVSLRLLGRETS